MTDPRLKFLCLTALFFAVAGVTACGDSGNGNGETARIPDGGDGDGDGDADDASTESDESDPMGTDEDAGTPMLPPGLDGSCVTELDKVYELPSRIALAEVAQVAVDPIEARFSMAYVGPSDTCVDALFTADISGGAAEGEPKIVQAIDECSVISSPALSTSGEGWLVALVDDRDGPHDLWVHPLDFDSVPTGDAVKIAGDLATVPDNPAMALIADDQIALVWTESSKDGSTRSLMLRMLKANGEPRADAVELDSSSTQCSPDVDDIDGDARCEPPKCAQPEDVCTQAWSYPSVRISPIGDGLMALAFTRRRSVLAGADEHERTLESYLDVFDRNGKATRGRRELTLLAGPDGNVDVSADEDGGAVVWTEGMPGCGPTFVCDDVRQVWFQQLDADGNDAPVESLNPGLDLGLMPATRIVNSPFRAVDVSVAKQLTTFMVTYRALPGGKGMDVPQVVLSFVDARNSAVMSTSDVALATEEGGATSTVTAFDGRVVIGWSDLSDTDDTVMKLVRLPCVGG